MGKERQPTILLGVTGSIAAYKACELLRLFQKDGLRVKVVMTDHAQDLVGAATFRALSGESVALDLFDDPRSPINHITLAKEADVFVIAPCTANVINKIAHGVADDLLTTTALACTSEFVIAPAMNSAMLENPITQESLRILEGAGVTIVGPGQGYLACGDVDSGRMAEPQDIHEATLDVLKRSDGLRGKKVLITAGPTREYLDPVRYISSPSSGKTGYALAREAACRGAQVVVVSGPVARACPSGVTCIQVTSALQMLEQASRHFDDADVAIFSAAVADFRPLHVAQHKLKKGQDLPLTDLHGYLSVSGEKAPADTESGDDTQPHDEARELSRVTLELTANPDILATLSARRVGQKERKPYVVGFAAETEDLLANAQTKLRTKDADLIIANDVSAPDCGFAGESNTLVFVDRNGSETTKHLKKECLAKIILDRIQKEL